MKLERKFRIYYSELAMSRKLDENSVMVGGIVPRFDNLNEVNEVNNRLALMFQRDVQ